MYINEGVTQQVYVKLHIEGATLVALNKNPDNVVFVLKHTGTTNYMNLGLKQIGVSDLPVNLEKHRSLHLLGIKLLEFRLVNLAYYLPQSYYESRPFYVHNYKNKSYFCVEIQLQDDWFYLICKNVFLDLENVEPPENLNENDHKFN